MNSVCVCTLKCSMRYMINVLDIGYLFVMFCLLVLLFRIRISCVCFIKQKYVPSIRGNIIWDMGNNVTIIRWVTAFVPSRFIVRMLRSYVAYPENRLATFVGIFSRVQFVEDIINSIELYKSTNACYHCHLITFVALPCFVGVYKMTRSTREKIREAHVSNVNLFT